MTTWNTIPSDNVINATVKNMTERGFVVKVVDNKEQALAAVKKLLPKGAEVMTGTSTTLKEVGVIEFLDSPTSGITNVHDQVTEENDEAKRHDLRRKAVTSQYFMASVNAITEEGQLVAVDATGSRVGAFHSAAEHLVLVVGANKITKDLPSAMQRIKEFVFPLEDKRATAAYGSGSGMNKWVILEREVVPGRVTVVLVKEVLGF